MSNATSSSIFTEQWIENRISTSGDYTSNRHSKIVRANPPPLNTYHSNEKLNHVVHKSTIITKNNICLTMLDLVNESSFEILYPLIYDSNALYILPVNLTILLNILQAANSLENIDQNEKSSKANDFDALLTEDWLNSHIFHYIESISDHCQEVFIAILGLMDKSQLLVHNQQELAQQLLDEIHSKMDDYLINKPTQYENLNRYSEFFPEPIDLTDEQMSTQVLEQFEVIAQQWNMIHHKQKRYFIKNRLGFNNQERLLIDYNTCLKYFEQQEQISLEHEEDIGENREIFEKELNHMSFDEHIEYLKLIGDIFSFGRKPNEILLLKPYVLLNDILSKTIFRPKLDQWLNYDENLIFRFSGYYPIQKTFEIDRQRLLNRGEFTWNMLHVLFHEQNNDNISLTDKNLLDYCRLMERLYLGYVNETNLTYKEFTTMYFVCPWLMKENCTDFDYIDYFKRLEQERQYETHRRERTRRIKQQQIWFSFDNDQESLTNETSLEINETFPIVIPELPFKDEIEIFDSQIINQESIIQTIQIHDEQSNLLPNGFYERLLICLHPLFHERLDYYNLTIGRTIDRSLIKIERSDEENEINITMNKNLLERIENLLSSNLFLLYPNIILRIET